MGAVFFGLPSGLLYIFGDNPSVNTDGVSLGVFMAIGAVMALIGVLLIATSWESEVKHGRPDDD